VILKPDAVLNPPAPPPPTVLVSVFEEPPLPPPAITKYSTVAPAGADSTAKVPDAVKV
jgi:hypothetical protein